MIPDLAGRTIEIIKIDYALQMWTEDNWFLRLASPVLVGRTGTPGQVLHVDGPDAPLPPELADLVGATITQLLVADGGDLVLQLGNRQLVAQAADDHETWEIAGHDGELLICTPGGALTYFPPVPGIGTPAGAGPTPPADVAPSAEA